MPATLRAALPAAGILAALALAQDKAAGPAGLTPAVPSSIVVEEKSLGNGLRVIVASRPGLGAVVCRLIIKSGFADDSPGEAGLALYLARLLDQGTQLVGVRDPERERESRRAVENFEVTYRSFFREAMEQYRRGDGPDPTDPTSRPAAIQKLRDVLAALEERHQRDLVPGEQHSLYARAGVTELETKVGMDATVFGATLPASRLEVFFALESDRLRNGVFRDQAATRDRIRREWVALREEDPAFRARDALRTLLFAGHPYGSPAAGSDSLDGLSQESIERERRRRIVASNMAVVVAGDVAAPPVFEMADRYLGMLSPGAPRDEAPPRPPRPSGPLRLEADAWTQSSVSLGWAAPGPAHRDFPALLAIAEILAARGAGSVSYETNRHGGLFLATSEVAANDRLPKAEESLRAAVEALRSAKVAGEELGRARRAAAGKFLDGLRDLREFADWLARAELCASPRELSEIPKKIAAVTPDDLQRAAQECFSDSARATLVLRRTHSAAPPKYEPPPPPPPPKPAPVESKPAKVESAPQPAESRPASQPATAGHPPASQPAAAPPSAAPAESRPASSPAQTPTAAGAPNAAPTAAPVPTPAPTATPTATSPPASQPAPKPEAAASQPAKVGNP